MRKSGQGWKEEVYDEDGEESKHEEIKEKLVEKMTTHHELI